MFAAMSSVGLGVLVFMVVMFLLGMALWHWFEQHGSKEADKDRGAMTVAGPLLSRAALPMLEGVRGIVYTTAQSGGRGNERDIDFFHAVSGQKIIYMLNVPAADVPEVVQLASSILGKMNWAVGKQRLSAGKQERILNEFLGAVGGRWDCTAECVISFL